MKRRLWKHGLVALVLAAASAAPAHALTLVVQGPTLVEQGGALHLGVGLDEALVVELATELWVNLDPAVFDLAGATAADLTGALLTLPGYNPTPDPGAPHFAVAGLVPTIPSVVLPAGTPFLSLTLPVLAGAQAGPTALAFRFGYDNLAPQDAGALPASFTVEVSAVPEPGAYVLFLAGLIAMLGIARRRA
jgi:hypothetical protein